MSAPWEDEDAEGWKPAGPWDSNLWLKGRLPKWHEIVLEGEWLQSQAMIQHEVGPEYEMHLNGMPRE